MAPKRSILTRYAWLSVITAIGVLALKLGAWWLTGSVGLLSDALETCTNLGGALMALLNRGHRREIEGMVKKIEKIETALEPHFQQLFIDAMAMPNKVDPFPELAKIVALPERKVITAGGEDGGGRRRRRERG